MQKFIYRTQLLNGTDITIKSFPDKEEVKITLHADKAKEIVLTSLEFKAIWSMMNVLLKKEDLE